MHNPRISCWTDVDYESQPAKTFSARAVSSQGAISAGLQINPGEVRNYFCDVGGAFNLHEGTSATGPIIPIKLADMLIVVDYETWLPWTITRQGLTKFIMFPTTKGFRWAKGDWVAGQGITWLPDFKPPWGNERPK